MLLSWNKEKLLIKLLIKLLSRAFCYRSSHTKKLSIPHKKLPCLGTAPVDEFGFATSSFSTWTVMGTELGIVLRIGLETGIGTGLGTELRIVLETVLGTGLWTGVGAPKAGKSRCPNEGWGVDLWAAFDLKIN